LCTLKWVTEICSRLLAAQRAADRRNPASDLHQPVRTHTATQPQSTHTATQPQSTPQVWSGPANDPVSEFFKVFEDDVAPLNFVFAP
jgi:hypothetical protein